MKYNGIYGGLPAIPEDFLYDHGPKIEIEQKVGRPRAVRLLSTGHMNVVQA